MKAVVFPSAEAITVEQVADPTPKADEVIVQVAMAGICGTDVHIYRNEYSDPRGDVKIDKKKEGKHEANGINKR